MLSSTDLQEVIEGMSLMGFVETWSSDPAGITLKNFTGFHKTKPKTKNKGRVPGGISVFVLNDLVSDAKIIETQGDEILWVKIAREGKEVVIGTVYRHPEGSQYHNRNLTI